MAIRKTKAAAAAVMRESAIRYIESELRLGQKVEYENAFGLVETSRIVTVDIHHSGKISSPVGIRLANDMILSAEAVRNVPKVTKLQKLIKVAQKLRPVDQKLSLEELTKRQLDQAESVVNFALSPVHIGSTVKCDGRSYFVSSINLVPWGISLGLANSSYITSMTALCEDCIRVAPPSPEIILALKATYDV